MTELKPWRSAVSSSPGLCSSNFCLQPERQPLIVGSWPIFNSVISKSMEKKSTVLEDVFLYVRFQVLAIVVFPVRIPNSTHFGRGTCCLDFSGDFWTSIWVIRVSRSLHGLREWWATAVAHHSHSRCTMAYEQSMVPFVFFPLSCSQYYVHLGYHVLQILSTVQLLITSQL